MVLITCECHHGIYQSYLSISSLVPFASHNIISIRRSYPLCRVRRAGCKKRRESLVVVHCSHFAQLFHKVSFLSFYCVLKSRETCSMQLASITQVLQKYCCYSSQLSIHSSVERLTMYIETT